MNYNEQSSLTCLIGNLLVDPDMVQVYKVGGASAY